MATFHLGVVSNCWAAQLPETGLEAQCAVALGRGHEYVELRQRALAECEETVPGDSRPWPLPDRLGQLAARFPEIGFNLAIELPFMTEPGDPDSPYLQRLCEAAVALAGAGRPLLRFVDVSPAPHALEQAQIQELGSGVANLTRALFARNIRTVLENSKQPVGSLLGLIEAAAHELGDVPPPLLCWDPANQRQQTFAAEDPVETARAVPVASFFEFHFKQLSSGALQPGVGEGDLDWTAILSAFEAAGYEGPALFEIPPGPDVWERLDQGAAYISALLAQIRGDQS